MNWSVRMVQQVCQVFLSPSDRWSFIQSVENMFSEVTMEMYEVVVAGEDMAGQVVHYVWSQIAKWSLSVLSVISLSFR